MKSKKELRAIFDRAKVKNEYYTFENFKRDCKSFLRDIKNREIVASMEVSRSGMLRKFNTRHHNALLNICYNQKYTWEPVRVGGCGMDMWWHLLFVTCETIATKQECEKYGYNSLCSHQVIL